MGDLQIAIAALFVSAAGLNALANWLAIPYPIPLVLGGLVLGLIPGIPAIRLDPDLVLLVFLPPLAPDDLGLQVDRLTLRAHELATELEALRLAVSGTPVARSEADPQ